MKNLMVKIGKDLEGNDVSINLNDGSTLIGGKCAVGKTNTIYNILDELLQKDCKNDIYFTSFKELMPSKYADSVCNIENLGEFNQILNDLQDEIFKRKEILSSSNCTRVDKYNDKVKDGEILNNKILIIDDANFLDDEHSRDIINLKSKLNHLMSICRPFGINIIISTQTHRVPNLYMQNVSQSIVFPTLYDNHYISRLNIPREQKFNKGDCIIIKNNEYTIVSTQLNTLS